ncbi:hypothetical protein [Hansschlegelia sp.]|uniref:hypothetical protein n=1 Tax=Hansschlegelia sp. TaxID=2041892 RepID=UPI002CA40DC6|nr:hypothetical protein [Hansschlegelia sp.]HVI30327.1 hypothetical protein [Hansschlegelia sp.]
MDVAIGSLVTPAAAVRAAGGAGARVEPAPQPERTGDQRSPGLAGPDPEASRREVLEDERTGTFVFRLVDVTSGEVTSQTPSEARLKLRAYIDALVADNARGPSLERFV